MMFFYLRYLFSFVKGIPLKIILALIVLAVLLFGTWLGYSHYKGLQSELIATKHELAVKELQLQTSILAFDELKRQLATQITAFTELERRRDAIETDWQAMLEELTQIGDCTDATLPEPVLPDADLDALNRLNGAANRMLRQD